MTDHPNDAYAPPPLKHPLRSHTLNAYRDDRPPSRDLLERNLARAEAELARAGETLMATARETRWGRFTDFTLMERYRHGQEVVRGLRSELSGQRRSVA